MKTKLIALMGALMLSNAYSAQTIVYNLDFVGVGTQNPLGTGPWGTITVTKIDSDSVNLTVASNLTNNEFFGSVGLNLVDDFQYNGILFTDFSQIGPFDKAKITYGNNVKSGGAGIKYDIWFEFTTSNSSGGTKRFNETDSFSYTVNGVSIDDFRGPVVAHAQNLTGGQSAWLSTSVPEPTSLLLGSMGVLFILTNRKR